MERPSRSAMFREMIKKMKEDNKNYIDKGEKKLPVHKKRVTEKQEKTR